MPATELVYWETVYQTELLGDERADYRTARVEAAIGNYAGKMLKDGDWLNAFDVMPFSDKQPDEPVNVADKIHATFGALMGLQQARLNADERELERVKAEATERLKLVQEKYGLGD